VVGLELIAWHNRRGGRTIEAQLRARGYEPNVILRTDDSATIQGLVAAGIGAAIVPRLTVDSNVAVVALELDGSFPDRVIALAWHRDRHLSAAAEGFLDVAQSVCAVRP